MRSTTIIHIAVRNIGDSQDSGTHHTGPVSECIIWLAQRLAVTSMATRMVIGIGRNKEDALRGIEVSGAGKSALNPDMQSMLADIFADADQLPDSQPAVTQVSAPLEGDDYVA